MRVCLRLAVSVAQPIPHRANLLDNGSATTEHLIGPVC
jgi:hypothetical protein